MARHILETIWPEAGDEAHNGIDQWMQWTNRAEAIYQKYERLWVLHGAPGDPNADQNVADQLFGGTATAEQVTMTQDMRLALQEIHNIFITADLGAIRKMT